MSSIPCKFGDKCTKKDCRYNHLKTPRRIGINPKLCHFGADCQTKNCTFAHLTPTKVSQSGKVNCKNDRGCTRQDCYFEHPNGRLIDENIGQNVASVTNISDYSRNRSSEELSIAKMIENIEELLNMATKDFEICELADEQEDDTESISDEIDEKIQKEFSFQRIEFEKAIEDLRRQFDLMITSSCNEKIEFQNLESIKNSINREMKRWQSRLPIYAHRTEIIKKLRENQVLILKADTGSGKSTQTVQYLYDVYSQDRKQIVCTQPRKLAARSLAARVAEEFGCAVGQEVGFQVGGGRPMTSKQTKIKFVTDTLLLNEYKNDSMLKQYSVVIVDEAHERKIDTDIVLGIMKLCLRKRRDLKLVVMSATLDMDLLYDYFKYDFSCDKLEVGGRTYPIEDIYLSEDVENYIQESVTKAIEIHKSGEIGDILVFLTGQDEIDIALADLIQKLGNDTSYIALPLHGKLSEEENAQIFVRPANKRKIIFSTNVAETSVTIDGIKHVIDSGMVKEKMWDEKRKMQVLKIGQITKSSVKQRRGRAGRTSSGKCYHLYTIDTYEAMDPCARAEVLCAQPTIALLKLKYLNIDRIETFEWLESPSTTSLNEAYQTLLWLNAIDSQNSLTDLGRNMARLDIDPKLTAMLYKGQEFDCLSYVLILAGMLTVSQNIWWSNKDQNTKDMATQERLKLSHENSDHITLINVYLTWNKFCSENKSSKEQNEWCKKKFVNAKCLKMANDFIKEKARQMEHELQYMDQLNEDIINKLFQCLTAGYFFNLAVSNGPLRAGYQVISAFPSSSNETTIARVFRTSTLCLNANMPQFILFHELLNLNGTNYITMLSSINPIWLKSISSKWYRTINGDNLNSIVYENYVFEKVGATLLRALIGKRNCNINRIEEMIQGIIDVDYKQSTLTVWSRPHHLQKAKKFLQEMIFKEKYRLENEVEEFPIIGRTRILMGVGGVSQNILLEDEYIRIILSKLPTTITEERIKQLCEPFGQIRQIDSIRQNQGGSCVSVTYTSIKEAHLAFTRLNGYVEQGQAIAVSSACVKTGATTSKQNCRLKAIWYLTESTGNARISFTKINTAQEAHSMFQQLGYQSKYELSTDLPTLKVIFYLAPNIGKAFVNVDSSQKADNILRQINGSYRAKLVPSKQNDRISICIEDLDRDFDEQDIQDHVLYDASVAGVQVLRGRKGVIFHKPDNTEDEIKRIFNHYRSFQRDTVVVQPKIFNGIIEARVSFLDAREMRDAIVVMNGRCGLIGAGKVRLSEQSQPKKKDNTNNKPRDNEYVVRLSHLDKSFDKYDLIRILQKRRLYGDVNNIIVYRKKLEENGSTKIIPTSEQQKYGLAALRSMFDREKALFRSKPDIQISSCTPDGTVSALILFEDAADVLKAVETYKNNKIDLFMNGIKVNLVASISYEIFINAALTKAIPEKVQQTIEKVREKFKRVFVKNAPSTTTNQATRIIIHSDDMEQLMNAKIQFDDLLKGTEYMFQNDLEKTRLLFDQAGTKALQEIQNKTNSYIWWNHSNSFIRIYGQELAINMAKKRLDEYIRRLLEHEKHTVTLKIPQDLIREVLREMGSYQENIGSQLNVEITSLFVQRQIRITGKQEDVILCQARVNKLWETMTEKRKSVFSSTDAITNNTSECPICCGTINYNLQACGHGYCLDCLKQLIVQKFDTTLSNQTLAVRCMMERCEQSFLLRDIKTIINATEMKKLTRASFQAYLKSDSDIVACMGMDCHQVYRQSEHTETYFCESCLKMYCLVCKVEFHIGFTCQEYQVQLRWKDEEKTIVSNIGGLGLKPCPSCKQVIDRYDGCNAVKCKCGISFCWLCFKTDPVDIHGHYNDRRSSCYQKCFATTI